MQGKMKMKYNNQISEKNKLASKFWMENYRIVIRSSSFPDYRGNRIALAPAVLASIYRDMTLLKGKIMVSIVLTKIAESTLVGTHKGIHDGLTVKLWLISSGLGLEEVRRTAAAGA
ncbi:hypothetical protein Peur_000397 [Populus x canadensis]